ncbi:MAG: phage virion morphogenesis protein [Rhodospirillales bacterium]|nr:phage virion morphogenesis protein [Rhodospirillales bacterium]
MTKSGIALTIKPEGIEALNTALEKLRRRDLKVALKDIGMSMVVATQRRFEIETDSSGRPWRPLSVATWASRAGGRLHTKRGRLTARASRLMNSGRILRDSNRLFASINYHLDGKGVEIGSNLAYARIHQLGGQAGRGRKVTIPARPYLGLNQADVDRCVEIIGSYLLTGGRA